MLSSKSAHGITLAAALAVLYYNINKFATGKTEINYIHYYMNQK